MLEDFGLGAARPSRLFATIKYAKRVGILAFGQRLIARVLWPWRVKVDPMAIEIDIFVRHPAKPSEPIRIDGVHHQYGGTTRQRAVFFAAQPVHLGAGTAESLDPVGSADHHQ